MAQKKKRPSSKPRRMTPVPTDCAFCTSKTEPDYKNWQALEKFMTDRKKILGRSRTGICARHQRKLTREIKRARHLALLPFTASSR